MANKGRKKKPTALKIIEGNAGKRALNPDEPKPKLVFKPRAPSRLCKVGQSKWRDLVRKLTACNVLTEVDLDALEMLCREWALMQSALADVEARGKMIPAKVDEKGDAIGTSTMWNPSWSQYKHSQGVVRSLMAEFGMTPASRPNVNAVPADTGAGDWSGF